MPKETENLAVLFADISRSTQIYDLLGDEAGQKLVADCLNLLAEVAESHQGTVIKTIGDEAMCSFPSANLAVLAGKDMHESLEKAPALKQPRVGTPTIRVGIHLGPVIRTDDDVFGDAVNVAARMVALAKPRQILTTEQTVEELTPEAQAMIRRIDKTTVKGKRERLNIYEVVWEQHEVTVMLQNPLATLALECPLKLRFEDQTVELDRSRPDATMGRHRDNDFVVDDGLASRVHARIEQRRGKFILIDQSTNGTYVLLEGKEPVCLRRDELPLHGSGMICLGRPLDEESPLAIYFNCDDS